MHALNAATTSVRHMPGACVPGHGCCSPLHLTVSAPLHRHGVSATAAMPWPFMLKSWRYGASSTPSCCSSSHNDWASGSSPTAAPLLVVTLSLTLALAAVSSPDSAQLRTWPGQRHSACVHGCTACASALHSAALLPSAHPAANTRLLPSFYTDACWHRGMTRLVVMPVLQVLAVQARHSLPGTQ